MFAMSAIRKSTIGRSPEMLYAHSADCVPRLRAIRLAGARRAAFAYSTLLAIRSYSRSSRLDASSRRWTTWLCVHDSSNTRSAA